jgi:hypothetical protein
MRTHFTLCHLHQFLAPDNRPTIAAHGGRGAEAEKEERWGGDYAV